MRKCKNVDHGRLTSDFLGQKVEPAGRAWLHWLAIGGSLLPATVEDISKVGGREKGGKTQTKTQ